MIFRFQFKKASRSQGEKINCLLSPCASKQPPGTIFSISSYQISLHGSVVTSLDQQLCPLPAPHCISLATCSLFSPLAALLHTSLTLSSLEQVPSSSPQATSSPASGMLFSPTAVSLFPFSINALPLPFTASGQYSPLHFLLPAHLPFLHYQLLATASPQRPALIWGDC